MYLAQLFAFLRQLANRNRRLAPAPVPVRVVVRLTLALALLSLGHNAFADVSISNDVWPANDRFTPAIDEGLPSAGNDIETAELVNHQTFFEGRHSDGANLDDPADDTNINFAVVVGQSANGTLTIDTNTALRDEDLVIGSAATVTTPSGSKISAGTGTVRITGFGAVYNNDPSILPAGLPTNFQSVVPRSTQDPDGFDLYVGTANRHLSGTGVSNAPDGIGGSGRLVISAGGRAEIEDAIVVGDVAGSSGIIQVDGIDSFLGSGGANFGQTTANASHSMIIGRQGSGELDIMNGGLVQTIASQTFSVQANVAASIGDLPFVLGGTQITPGASGIVKVDGTASKWVLGGTLQVGGFTDVRSGGPTGITDTDADGINSALFYSSRAGQGALTVSNGATVEINLQPGINPNQNPPLYLAVGEKGVVTLAGGTINIGEADSTGQNSTGDRSQIVNDGVVTGTGTINTGVFRNRYMGRVQVNYGQTLTIYANSNLLATLPASGFRPWNNWGSIEAIGNEQAPATINFERQSIPSTQNPAAPFFNWSVAPAAPGNPSKDGIISCASCVLRFGSGNAGNPFDATNPVVGLRNFGVLAFNSGTNYVTGNVLNMPASAALNTVAGRVLFSNQTGTTVTFENDFFNLAGPTVPNATAINILARHSFGTNGLTVNIDTQHPNPINANGDVYLTGNLNVTLANVTPGSLFVGATIPLILFQGTIGTLDVSNPDNPTVDLTKPGHFTGSNLNTISLLPYGLPATDILDILYGTNSISLIVKAIGNASGSDFNGDGIVNSLDLAIWQAHVGTTSGASVIDGDANGDGRVDGADFLIWQKHFGGAPGAGSGSSLENATGTVPEPTTVALLAMCGLASLPIRRRRAG